MSFEAPEIPGLVVTQRSTFRDARGTLSRLFSADEFSADWFPASQVNHSVTLHRGTVRGMHYQRPPDAEKKLVTCVRGSVFDVAVDLRKNSETFLKWYGLVLSAENQLRLLIPEGFAHGFQTLTEGCELIYLHAVPYRPESEAGVSALDPLLAIKWPLGITQLSERDRSHPQLTSGFEGVEI